MIFFVTIYIIILLLFVIELLVLSINDFYEKRSVFKTFFAFFLLNTFEVSIKINDNRKNKNLFFKYI